MDEITENVLEVLDRRFDLKIILVKCLFCELMLLLLIYVFFYVVLLGNKLCEDQSSLFFL